MSTEKSKPSASTENANNNTGKKVIDGIVPSPVGQLGGFGMYPMYPNMPPYYPPGHPEAGKPIPVPQTSAPPGRDPKDTINAPPLDLINKPPQVNENVNQQQTSGNKDVPQSIMASSGHGSSAPSQGPPGKPGIPPHYFPIG